MLAYPKGVWKFLSGVEAEALAIRGGAHAEAPVERAAQDLGA